ncbi:hypothetical protein [Wenjunlia tyrosinilytica]|uniref:Integral membrane protein n=1 Tax=Wenjunlia tyrosinilytica TaxID=1544741 RepID=A0A918DXB9_9ACTN|nr:hypothetical protein [Wenjunlia tyrosinilytica]GGO88292.1 hypothetical protein GCM10012280_28760 [Wenjunlia tyrosinilytica]
MNGPGIAPPPQQPRPNGAGGVTTLLRVLFMAAPFLTCGALSFVPMLRIALRRRRPLHWVIFVVVVAASIASFVLVEVGPDADSWQVDVGVTGMLVLALAVPTYFLVMDVRHQESRREHWQARQTGSPPYSPYPYGGTPVPAPSPRPPLGHSGHNPYRDDTGATPPPPPSPLPNAVPAPLPTPIPAPAQPHRIDRVRAELDEISDYLRKQEEGR